MPIEKKKTEDGENLFFKALGNTFWLSNRLDVEFVKGTLIQI